jgi:NAD(P) transhydrogenase
MSQYDLIVIGSGPAGAKGAEEAARLGKTVALIERAPRLGGAGINTGTVPSKTLRETAACLAGLRQRGMYGVNFNLQSGLTLGDFMYRRQMVLEAEWGLIQRNIERYRIQIVRGEATLHDPHTARVRYADGRTADLTGAAILLAPGSTAYHPPQIPFDDPRIFDAATVPDMEQVPRAMVIVGGGVIGAEYASIFTALGVQVTLVEAQDRILRVVDAELAERFKRLLEDNGTRVVLNEPVVSVVKSAAGLDFHLQNGEAIACDAALIAAGRVGNTRGLGLEKLGIAVDAMGYIAVNEHMQTHVPSVYAAGDAATRNSWAPISMEQGRTAVRHAFNAPDARAGLIPLAVFAVPEIAMVGLNEDQCKAQGRPYLIGRAYADQNPRGQIIGETSGLLKIIFAPHDKTLLGIHLLGEGAAELIHLGLFAMKTGATLETFTQLIYNYPTLSDLYEQAAYNGLQQWERWRQRQE